MFTVLYIVKTNPFHPRVLQDRNKACHVAVDVGDDHWLNVIAENIGPLHVSTHKSTKLTLSSLATSTVSSTNTLGHLQVRHPLLPQRRDDAVHPAAQVVPLLLQQEKKQNKHTIPATASGDHGVRRGEILLFMTPRPIRQRRGGGRIRWRYAVRGSESHVSRPVSREGKIVLDIDGDVPDKCSPGGNPSCPVNDQKNYPTASTLKLGRG